MATSDDLTGLGMPFQISAELGYNPTNLTGLGTAQVGAAPTLSKNVYINAQTGQTAVAIGGTPKIGTPHWFTNGTVSNSSALVFVPVGHNLNGSLGTTPFTLAQNTFVMLQQVNLKNWYSK